MQLLRDLGPAIRPFNAFLIAQGIETLSLRIERHVANAQRVAEWLEPSGPRSSRSPTPGCRRRPGSSGRRSTRRVAPARCSRSRSRAAARRGERFVDALELHSHVANIGDVRSLVIHPASTTHSQLTPEEQLLSGVTPGLIRLAVGLEGIEDILADLEAGFAASKSS